MVKSRLWLQIKFLSSGGHESRRSTHPAWHTPSMAHVSQQQPFIISHWVGANWNINDPAIPLLDTYPNVCYIHTNTYTRILRTSLVVQRFRIHLPKQGKWVGSPVQEDSTCQGATKAVYYNNWAHEPRVQAPHQEKPPRWEACAPQLERSPL